MNVDLVCYNVMVDYTSVILDVFHQLVFHAANHDFRDAVHQPTSTLAFEGNDCTLLVLYFL